MRVSESPGELSVVIVTWNSARVLPACIASMDEHLAGCVAEILVVDNGSQDASYLEAYRDHPRVRVIRNGANLGFAKANNIAIAQAKGSHILILNPDVRFETNPVPALLGALDSRPDLALVSPLLHGEDGRPQVDGYYMAFPTLLQYLLLHSLLARAPGVRRLGMRLFRARIPAKGLACVDQVPGAFMLFRRDLPVDRPILDETFFIWMEDVDLCQRISRSGLKVGVLPEERAIHSGGASFRLVGADRNRRRFWTSYQAYLRKHRGPAALRLELAVMAMDSAATFAALVVANLARGRFARAAQAARSEAGIFGLTLRNLLLPSGAASHGGGHP